MTTTLTTESPAVPRSGGLWWREASGAVADLGVLVPIAVALIVANGLSPTAVLLPAGLLYLVVARVYRLPVAVQPLKAFGAVAIAAGLGADVIAAGALLMGAIFLLLGLGGGLDRVARFFPTPVIRGVQLSVGLLFMKVAWGLVTDPPSSFANQWGEPWLIVIAVVLFAALLWLRNRVVLLVIVGALLAAVALLLTSGATLPGVGPSPLAFPALSLDTFAVAFVLLVLPQLPLTFANSCLAPADAARTYFGAAAQRVTPSRLARTLGGANVVAGAISGMPVCHGAGGLSAHYAFGARTWRAPLLMGAALVGVAVGLGAVMADLLPLFPVSVLAALLGVAAVVHIGLLRDLRGATDWSIALLVGVVGVGWNLGVGVLLGLALAWGAHLARTRKDDGADPGVPADRGQEVP